MKVLITGGFGHLGSWTAYTLIKKGVDVAVYDVDSVVPECLKEVEGQFKFVQGDVLDYAQLEEAARTQQADAILHTVAIMGPFVPEDPYANVSLNVQGMINVLEVARTLEIPHVVYTSTGAVYKPVAGIVDEDGEIGPTDLYGATKVAAELIGKQYARQFGFEFRVCRVYFLYGPGRLPSELNRLYQMSFGALEGMDGLNMDSGGDQKLDFTYIEDAARGTALLTIAEDLPGNVYNIATGEATSVGQAIAASLKHSHFQAKVNIGPGSLWERAEALDIERARKDLDFEPKFELDVAVKKYADWIRKVKTA